MPHALKHAAMHWLDAAAFPSHDAPPPLAPGDVHLWLWHVPDADPAHAAADAGARLRRTLAGMLDVDRHALEFVRGAHGKPALAQPDAPQFNLSHSGTLTALALARDVEVGVDVERPRRARDVLPLAQRFFAPAETAVLARLPAPAREAAFYALWTCKEAVLKALGRGIAFGLDRLEFALDPTDGMPRALAHIAVEGGRADQWHVRRFAPIERAFGALAWRGPSLRVRGFHGTA